MAVELTAMRDLLLPGLFAVRGSYSVMPYAWVDVFAEEAAAIPTLNLPAAVAIGAAAVLIQNPEVSRRSLFSWWNGE